MVAIYVNGVNMTGVAFPQGDNLAKEVSFLLWWATGQGYVPAYSLYHKKPVPVNVCCPMVGGTLIGIKEKGGHLFEVYA